ncbi:hypothetical protein B0I00_3335 [Novosphingobium kunmingense]|uniref:Uncharacterized protein n=1 Tax=Novosphingobium kunmingense TaxID=1211806 RepID=A0A2N0H2Z7_9SPHN|nr:hypothetical protein [Novosphingobium kunmingense]PKB13298.1 hypothetical protein B0I00_3335 [Novosphingobium kunmingense]
MEPLSERIARRALIAADAFTRDRLVALAFELRAQGERLPFTGPAVRRR